MQHYIKLSENQNYQSTIYLSVLINTAVNIIMN